MKIIWKMCRTYDEAKNYSRIIYLHEWDGKPFYWGKAHNSFFGGQKRNRDDLFASGRYSSGYRHWIEGCLQHGARLYIGQLDPEGLANINALENLLIYKYGHVMNTHVTKPAVDLEVEHKGDVPLSITAQP